uniref:Uncharacterized protein n=1 Tax=Cucumis melo TaxID=3656 RepID=A0A9I9EAJ1_CUCME
MDELLATAHGPTKFLQLTPYQRSSTSKSSTLDFIRNAFSLQKLQENYCCFLLPQYTERQERLLKRHSNGYICGTIKTSRSTLYS